MREQRESDEEGEGVTSLDVRRRLMEDRLLHIYMYVLRSTGISTNIALKERMKEPLLTCYENMKILENRKRIYICNNAK